ncbi:S8 family peptidase [Emcibacter sp.]|uniref:S8 family peptidase n=1 Tax=Emcibacter sp. TaxID=1979954 RepID=UPI002AA7DAA9|nr:S8 family peptidase [Emcibacter sp.]
MIKMKGLFVPVSLAFFVAGCGGSGGGGGLVTSPTPTTSTPVPVAPVVNYNTSEYRLNYGLDQMGAIAAYEEGITGEGITVAVIDSGIDTDNPELVGNISPDSISIFTNSYEDVEDVDGHGTAVAGVIAAVKNSTWVHGVAYNSTILAINAADPGTCGSPDDCEFYDNDIADAVDYAVAQGASVINISLGGDARNNDKLQNALRDAVEAGVVIVVSAGNIEDAAPPGTGDEPEASALDALESWANGQIIIAGSVDKFNEISYFSYKAGTIAQEVFLVAAGEEVPAVDIDEEFIWAYSGTSFSAPHIAGAAALLFEAFPNLTGQEVAELLYSTATDLGDPGLDEIYGSGLVNLTAAFAPQGTTSLAVQTTAGDVVILSTDNTVIYEPGAFGSLSAVAGALSSSMMLDGYNRSFSIDLGSNIHLNTSGPDLATIVDSSLQARDATLSLSPTAAINFSWKEEDRFREIDELYFSNLNSAEKRVRDLRFSFRQELEGGAQFSLARGLTVAEITSDYNHDDFLTIGKGDFLSLMLRDNSETALVGLPLEQGTRLRMSMGQGQRNYDDLGLETESSLFLGELEHDLSPYLTAGFDLGMLHERGTVLGSLSDGALKIGDGASSLFGTLRFDYTLSRGLSLFGNLSYGLTTVEATSASLLGNMDRLVSRSFSLGLKGRDLAGWGEQISLAVSQPLRVENGQADVSYVAGRDYVNDTLDFASRQVSLAPDGREVDIELAVEMANFFGASLRMNLLHQINPGHSSTAGDISSVLFRLSSGF